MHNGAIAIQSLNQVGYLFNPELIKEITSKIPSALIYAFNRYIHASTSDEPRLIKLAKFLLHEAEMECVAGTTSRLQKSKSVFTNVVTESGPDHIEIPQAKKLKSDAVSNKTISCDFCNRNGHSIIDCRKFASKLPKQRWFWAKNNKACFKCLGKNH